METKNCTACEAPFDLFPKDIEMYAGLGVPNATLCVTCRWKHLLELWTFGRFRKTRSALTGITLITTYSESVKFPIYDKGEWLAHGWDPLVFGTEYDPSRSFFAQLEELHNKVPHPHQQGAGSTNSDWSNDVWESKNCYLSRSLLQCENVDYCYRTFACKNCVDVTYSFSLERCYDCLHCFNSYRIKHSFDARDCIDSAFLYDCRNVQNSFMCWNLRNKQYCIENVQYTKEEYAQKLKEYDTRSYRSVQELKKRFKALVAERAIHRADHTVKVTDSFGNFLSECKNCYDCFFLDKSENCRTYFRGFSSKDSIDVVGSGFEERGYGNSCNSRCYETVSSMASIGCRYSAYLDICNEVEYCFGCVGLSNKKYCILNKQYTKEEYESLRKTIIKNMERDGEWGKYLPRSFAHTEYEFSHAQLHFPQPIDVEESRFEGTPGYNLPDSIDAVGNSILDSAIICTETGRRFSIAPSELAFCRENGIPIPQEHPDWRTMDRFTPLRNVNPIGDKCSFCLKDIVHYYPPEMGYQTIACTECYQREVA